MVIHLDFDSRNLRSKLVKFAIGERRALYFHAPLNFDRANGGYYYTDGGWDFSLNSISAEDVFYLTAAKTLLSGFEGSLVYHAISEVIDFVTDTQGIGKSSLLKRIAVPPKPKTAFEDSVWKNLLNALQGNLIVEGDYNGRWNTDTTHRRFAPYSATMSAGMLSGFFLWAG